MYCIVLIDTRLNGPELTSNCKRVLVYPIVRTAVQSVAFLSCAPAAHSLQQITDCYVHDQLMN
jgi:hypothetical protein